MKKNKALGTSDLMVSKWLAYDYGVCQQKESQQLVVDKQLDLGVEIIFLSHAISMVV